MVNEHFFHSTNPRIYHMFLPFLPSTIHYLFSTTLLFIYPHNLGFIFVHLRIHAYFHSPLGSVQFWFVPSPFDFLFFDFYHFFSKLNWTKETLYTIKDIFLQSIYTLYLKAYPAVLVSLPSPPPPHLRIPNAETPNWVHTFLLPVRNPFAPLVPLPVILTSFFIDYYAFGNCLLFANCAHCLNTDLCLIVVNTYTKHIFFFSTLLEFLPSLQLFLFYDSRSYKHYILPLDHIAPLVFAHSKP